jgi:hypothetical protein
MATYPVTEATSAGANLIAGRPHTMLLPVATGVPAVNGQVLVWNKSTHKFEACTAVTDGNQYGVFWDDTRKTGAALGADTYCDVILKGEVNFYALDATSQALGLALKAALGFQGIFARAAVSADAV